MKLPVTTRELAVLAKDMQVLKQAVYLSVISIVIHTIIKYLLPKLIEWPTVEEVIYIVVISTMTVYIILSYFLIKRWDSKKRPAFLKCLAIIFISQTVTIFGWTLFGTFDIVEFLWKTLIFALIVPLLLLAILFAIQGRSDDLLPSDLF